MVPEPSPYDQYIMRMVNEAKERWASWDESWFDIIKEDPCSETMLVKTKESFLAYKIVMVSDEDIHVLDNLLSKNKTTLYTYTCLATLYIPVGTLMVVPSKKNVFVHETIFSMYNLTELSRQCRTEKAEVLSIESVCFPLNFEKAISYNDPDFVYRVGKTVNVDNFETSSLNIHRPGIHCFMSKFDALDYADLFMLKGR